MPARKRSRMKRVKAKRDLWTHPKVEVAFRDINDGRKLFNMLPYTREDMPLGVLRDRLKILDDSERWLKRKRKAQEAKKEPRA